MTVLPPTFAYPSPRQAWLVLGSLTMQLDYPPGGWVCQSLDLGYPTVRAVVSNRPDMDGVDDRTQYFAERTVTAQVTALAGAGARIDDVADNFAPFMSPAARPVLHFVLDRPGATERTLTLRAAGYAWPIVGNSERDIQLQWVAADPICRDVNTQTEIAWSGSSAVAGRTYPLTFNRTYPAGGGAANTVTVSSPGDVGVRPLIRIYGPITKPQIVVQAQPAGSYTYFTFQQTFTLGAGQWVDVDAAHHTVLRQSDPTQNAVPGVDWSNSTWPYIQPLPASAIVSLNGQSTSGVTQAQVIWNDGYLT